MICGIDPGMSGGVAFLDNDGKPIRSTPMPLLDKRVRTDLIMLEIDLNLGPDDMVVVELQSIRQAQKGAMAIGANYGRIMAAVEMSGRPNREITPTQWNRHFSIPAGLKGRPKKEASYHTCRQLWGKRFSDLDIPISKDGLYEALLIARFAFEKF